MSATSHLVFFVTDPVDDGLAAAVRARVRDAGAGFFDDPGAPDASARTTGGYLRLVEADTEAHVAFDVHAVAISRDLRVRLELQWREVVLGRLRDGAPDAALSAWRAGLERDRRA